MQKMKRKSSFKVNLESLLNIFKAFLIQQSFQTNRDFVALRNKEEKCVKYVLVSQSKYKYWILVFKFCLT